MAKRSIGEQLSNRQLGEEMCQGPCTSTQQGKDAALGPWESPAVWDESKGEMQDGWNEPDKWLQEGDKKLKDKVWSQRLLVDQTLTNSPVHATCQEQQSESFAASRQTTFNADKPI